MLYKKIAHGSFYIFKRVHKYDSTYASVRDYRLAYGAPLFFNMSVEKIIQEYGCSATDVVVLVCNRVPICYVVRESGFTIAYEFFDVLEDGYGLDVELAIADRYVTFQQVSVGYDYSIYDESFKLLDGGVYDDPFVPYFSAVDEVIRSLQKPTLDFLSGSFLYDERIVGGIPSCVSFFPVEFEEELSSHITTLEFKKKTEEKFMSIEGLSAKAIEDMVISHAKRLLNELGDAGKMVQLVGCVLSGSRCRGLESEGSDIDVVLEYRGDMKEYCLFNLLNGENQIKIGNIPVDINPIRKEESGTLGSCLASIEMYLADKLKGVQS